MSAETGKCGMGDEDANARVAGEDRGCDVQEEGPCNLRYGISEESNKSYRRTMEDAHTALCDFGDVQGQGFFAIYDGHAGSLAAQWCSKNLHNLFLKNLTENAETTTDPQDAFNKSYIDSDQALDKNKILSGCTTVTCFIQVSEDKRKRFLYTANVGDARAVLSRGGVAIRLTYDHKASDRVEEIRVTKKGGMVFQNRVSGVIAVSRALGDIKLKTLVIGAPYTTKLELEENDCFLILACDGVWDVMTDQEAIDLIIDEENPEVAAKMIVDRSLELDTRDNVTVIVVILAGSNKKKRDLDNVGSDKDEITTSTTSPCPEEPPSSGNPVANFVSHGPGSKLSEIVKETESCCRQDLEVSPGTEAAGQTAVRQQRRSAENALDRFSTLVINSNDYREDQNTDKNKGQEIPSSGDSSKSGEPCKNGVQQGEACANTIPSASCSKSAETTDTTPETLTTTAGSPKASS